MNIGPPSVYSGVKRIKKWEVLKIKIIKAFYLIYLLFPFWTLSLKIVVFHFDHLHWFQISLLGDYSDLFCSSLVILIFFYFRSCWVCFATDEDDRTAEWVRPCKCRGSTKWVHQACLQRWVDEKQRGNSTARVACPQCNAEYLIVFPKLGKINKDHKSPQGANG